MQQQPTGSINTPQIPHSSTGLEPPAPIRYPRQVSEGLHPLTITPGIIQDTVSGHTPSTSFGMTLGTRPGRAPSVVPGSTLDTFHSIALPGSTPAKTPGTTSYTPATTLDRASDTTSEMTPGSISRSTTGIARQRFPDICPGSCNTDKMHLVAAPPRSSNAPSAIKMPRQVATPSQQPILQSQKCKASVTAASPSTQQGTSRPKSITASEPLDQHTVQHNDRSNDPQQQVHSSPAMPESEMHQPAPDDTAAQSSSKKSRKKLLQQCVLPFRTANGEPVTAPAKPLVPAKSRTKKLHKQPVRLVCCVT